MSGEEEENAAELKIGEGPLSLPRRPPFFPFSPPNHRPVLGRAARVSPLSNSTHP
jgi:hypothetical protein